MMLAHPEHKYAAFPVVQRPQRRWPNQILTQAPRWCSTDLRDGNQALANPMDGASKAEYFQYLVEIGFKEIEVAFPANSLVFVIIKRLFLHLDAASCWPRPAWNAQG